MGYETSSIEGSIWIPTKNKENLFAELKSADFYGDTIEECLGYQGFEIDQYNEYDGMCLYFFHGRWEERLFWLIAPFADDSEMSFQGEEGDIWRVVYIKGQMYEQNARVVFDDLTDDNLVDPFTYEDVAPREYVDPETVI